MVPKLIVLYYNNMELETTEKIAALYDLKEFDEIPNSATLYAIVSTTDLFLSTQYKEQP